MTRPFLSRRTPRTTHPNHRSLPLRALRPLRLGVLSGLGVLAVVSLCLLSSCRPWLSNVNSTILTDPALATGYAALNSNPAALALPGNPVVSLRLLATDAGIGLSSLNLDDMRRHFLRSGLLTPEDKDALLAAIGPDPLVLRAGAHVQGAHGQVGQTAWGADCDGRFSAALPPALFDLALNGNKLDHHYSMDGFGYGDVIFLRAGVSQAFRIRPGLGVGVGLNWLHGFHYSALDSSFGELLTTRYAATGISRQFKSEAHGGDGFSLTLGAAYELWDVLRIGVCARDIMSGIWWSRSPGTRIQTLSLDSLNVSRFLSHPRLNYFAVTHDTFIGGSGFWSPVPGVFALAVGWTPLPTLRVALVTNLPISRSPFYDNPTLVGIEAQIHLLQTLGLGVSVAGSSASGIVEEVLIGAHVLGVEAELGANAGGPTPIALRSVALHFGIGLQF
jgi:hypothetical protein